jgi:5-formyltetrahydrofolate cyclo-ligase
MRAQSPFAAGSWRGAGVAADHREVPVTSAEPELTPTKLALRRTVRAQREGRGAAEAERVAEHLAMVALELPAIRRARCVALYGSLPDEPGTGPLRAALRTRGTRVLLPVVADEKHLDWAEDTGELAAVAGAAGLPLPEPPGPRLGPDALADAEVVIVPALAVDVHGTRLGRGRGYYDRALHHVSPDALVLAMVHDDEVLDADTPVPGDTHDVAVHGAVTPTRWMFFNQF